MLTLEDRLRRASASERDRLRHLQEDVIPSLGRDETVSVQEHNELNEEQEQSRKQLEDIQARLDRNSQRKQKLAQLKKRMEDRARILTNQQVELESGLRHSRELLKDLEANHKRQREELNSAIAEKEELHQRLQETHISAVNQYMSEMRIWLEECCDHSRRQQELQETVERFEKARSTDPDIMDLWESYQEVRRLLSEATVQSVKQKLNEILAETECCIERKFPGAVRLREQIDVETEEACIYAWQDEKGGLRILLPLSRDDVDALESTTKATTADFLMHSVWAIARALAVDPKTGELLLSKSDWLMLRVPESGAKTSGTVVAVALAGGDRIQFHIRTAPEECADSFRDPEDETSLSRIASAHPLAGVAFMSQLADFDALWPVPEEGLSETLTHLRADRESVPDHDDSECARGFEMRQSPIQGLSDYETHALIELWRKGKAVPEAALKRYLGNCQDPRGSIRTLVKRGLIVKEKKGYSLNSQARRQIAQLAPETEKT